MPSGGVVVFACCLALSATAAAAAAVVVGTTPPSESNCPTANTGGLDMTINVFRLHEANKWKVEFSLSGNDFTKQGTQGINFYNPASAVGSYFLQPYGGFYSDVKIQHNNAGNSYISLNKTSSGFNGTTSHVWSMSSEAAAQYCSGPVGSGKCSVLQWTVNISDSMEKLASIGQLVASTHAYDHHILLSGYGTFLVPHGYEMCELNIVFISLPVEYSSWVTRGPHLPPNPTFFQVMDAPLLLADPAVLGTFPIVSNQTLYTVSEKSAAVAKTVAPMQKRLQTAVRQATLGLSLAGLWDEDIPFHVFWELTKPGEANGWAMEHNSCFQAMDNTTAHWDPWLLEDYQASHHMTHARFIPRRLFTTVLEPWSQIAGQKSGFIWFSEGWAQYAAYSFLGRAGFHTTEEILLSFCSRFAPAPHFQRHAVQALNMSLYEISKLQYTDQDLWFYNFAAGALIALEVDCQNSGRLIPALINLRHAQKSQFPEGLPEDRATFTHFFESHTGDQTVSNMTAVFDAYIWKRGGVLEDVPGLLERCLGVAMDPATGAFTVHNATSPYNTPTVKAMRAAFTP